VSAVLNVTRECAAIANPVAVGITAITIPVATMTSSLPQSDLDLWVIERGTRGDVLSLSRSDKYKRGEQQHQCKQLLHDIPLGFLKFELCRCKRDAAIFA
jgi:hypothetical protein